MVLTIGNENTSNGHQTGVMMNCLNITFYLEEELLELTPNWCNNELGITPGFVDLWICAGGICGTPWLQFKTGFEADIPA